MLKWPRQAGDGRRHAHRRDGRDLGGPVEQAQQPQQLDLRAVAEPGGEGGHHPAWVPAPLLRHVQVGDLPGSGCRVSRNRLQVAGQQRQRQRMVAEGGRGRLQLGVGALHPADAQQPRPASGGDLLQVLLRRRRLERGQVGHRLAGGDHAQAGVVPRQLGQQDRQAWVLDLAALDDAIRLQRLHAVQHQQRLLLRTRSASRSPLSHGEPAAVRDRRTSAALRR